MKRTTLGAILMAAFVAGTNTFGQQVPRFLESPQAAQGEEYQAKLRGVIADKEGYAAAIVQRWENDARAAGRWDPNYATDLQQALMRLQPENLLSAGEASSYEAMMQVLASGRQKTSTSVDSKHTMLTQLLGDIGDDMVYTPVTPCRIIDTRGAVAGALNGARTFDVDGSDFSSQGGSNSSCGIPFGVARAVAMTITVTQPVGTGFLNAWALGTQPLSSVVDFVANETLANTTIIPVVPGPGNDFTIFSSVTSHVVVDVVGYYAAPVATALDCITANSAVTAVAGNVWTPIDAVCPAGRTATGGGWDTPEGTLGYPGVWITSSPGARYGINGWRVWVDNQAGGNRSIQAFVTCCRVPGR